MFYDVSAKPLSPLERNDPVRIEDDEGWNTKATVLQEVAPRSYTVETEDGQVVRRSIVMFYQKHLPHLQEHITQAPHQTNKNREGLSGK